MTKVSAKGVARHQRSVETAALKRAARKDDAARKAAGIPSGKPKGKTNDSFQNFSLNLGQGTNNALSSSTYGFNPITRIRTELEWIHRGSWLGGVAVDIPADDMTREGVEILADMPPDDKEKIEELAEDCDVWGQLNAANKWAALYGGAIVVPLLDGHDLSTPLNPERVPKGSFKGLLVLDRWSVEPSLEDLVTQPGPDLGKPRFYTVTSDAPGFRQQRIHYTRAFRFIGIELPYWQAVMENLWGISIFERLYDRMVAFDSASTGAAQLVYRAWVRTLKMKNLREAVATGGDMLQGVVRSVELMKTYQSIEGISLIDDRDTMEYNGSAASFSGIGEAMLQFAQQLSGAIQVPLVRMFGQSPAGLNSTGDSELRMYYDGIGKRQKKMKRCVTAIYEIMARSLGINVQGGIRIKFKPLWQLDDKGKAEVGKAKTETILGVYDSAVFDRSTALKELRAISSETGLFTNITDEMIEEAENDPPIMQPGELQQQQQDQAEAAAQDPKGEGQVKPGAANVQSTGSSAGLNKTQDAAIGQAIRPRLVDFQGIPLFIESFGGQARTGTSPAGEKWRAVLANDYGYFEGTKSAEGPFEQMDMFLGPNPLADVAFVIDQIDPDTKMFDEHKIMLGFNSLADALRSYVGSYSDRGVERIGSIKPMAVDELKGWLHTADVMKPANQLEMAMP